MGSDFAFGATVDFFSFSEVRLSPSPVCRAWTEKTGCLDAVAWDRERETLPVWRGEIESLRMRISNTLAVQGIDPLGVSRSLAIHESSASMTRDWLRSVGFVHLDTASGIHLYCAWNAFVFFLQRLEARGRFLRAVMAGIRGLLPPILWFFVWSLAGFRPGLLRPLILVGVRFLGERRGIRWTRFVPILAALAVDAFLAFAFSFGTEKSFADWAPGEFHYALSWWGGIWAAEIARNRGWKTWGMHLALSFGSWFAVLPLDLWDGRFSPATPFLSFLTIEFLARGGYALFLVSAVGAATGSDWATAALEWESVLWNRGIGWLSGELTRLDLIRFI